MPLSRKPIFSFESPMQGTAPFLVLAFALFVAVDALYGKFLWNPLVFDDHNFFKKQIVEGYAHSSFDFGLRWFSYASIGWTYRLFGENMIWFRMGSLLLHFSACLALFLFLRRLFDAVLRESPGISGDWLAFFASLLFALHPVSVYAAGYLIERSTVMASLFGFLMLRAYLEGVMRESRIWFLISSLCYFLAVFSKEHAVMMPAVALAMTSLLKKPQAGWIRTLWLPFFLFFAMALLVVLKQKGVLGTSYEIYGASMIESKNVSVSNAYPLSVVTQCWLFFKYLGLWLVPDPSWMAVDMREPFATGFFEFPQFLGLIGFIIYPVVAVKLLLRGGKVGLFGFGLLFPWLLFATELSTIRIQEPFVLYRSYLWMGGFFAVFPLVFSRMPAKIAFVVLLAIPVILFPLARRELTMFSSPLRLWSQAAKLTEGRSGLNGLDRIYYNLGKAELGAGEYADAEKSLTRVVTISPNVYQAWYLRGTALYYEKKLNDAVSDFDKTIALYPSYGEAYFMRALTYRRMKVKGPMIADFRKSCDLGFQRACVKLKEEAGLMY